MPRRLDVDNGKDIIISRFNSGEQIKIIASDFKTDPATIKSRLKKWGVYKSRGKKIRERQCFSEQEKRTILKMHESGDGFVKIGKAIKCRPVEVSKYIKSLGLFIPRRNKNFKLKISDKDILLKYKETGGVRETSRALHNLNQKYIGKVLRKNGISELNYNDLYNRLEAHKDEIIAMNNDPETCQNDFVLKFGITRHNLRCILKKWGVYKKNKIPNKIYKKLKELKLTEKEVVEKYKELKLVKKTALFFNLSYNFIDKILKVNNIPNFFNEKYESIIRDKESIIYRYTILKESCQKIANSYDVWSTTILEHLKQWNIPIINARQQEISNIIEQNKENIIKWFINNELTCGEIGEKIGTSKNVIIRRLKSWGIKPVDTRFKESGLERKFKNILNELKIQYEQYYKIGNRIYDFYLNKYNLIVETNGDYWHGNPKKFNILKEEQLNGRKRDVSKRKLALKYKYRIIFLWESEIEKSKEKVVQILLNLDFEIPNQDSALDFIVDK